MIEADSHFFSEMARVSEAGYHRIVFYRDLAVWIVENCDITVRHKKRIEAIRQKFYKNYQLLESSDEQKIPVLSVVYGDDELTKVGKFKWRIGHNILLAKKYHERTRLLAEDRNDCNFYQILFNAEAARIEFGDIDFLAFSGGGKNINREFQEFIKENIVVCICDSDQLVPDGEYKDTYIEVLKSSQTLNYVGELMCTPGHEAENFIPINIVHSLANNKGLIGDASENLKTLIDSQGQVAKNDCLGLYYDTKEGVSEDKLTKACSSEDQELWVKKKYGDFFSNGQNSTLPKYQGNIMRNFIRRLETSGKFEKEYADFLKSKYWKLHYSDWVLHTLWYFCADDKTIKPDN